MSFWKRVLNSVRDLCNVLAREWRALQCFQLLQGALCYRGCTLLAMSRREDVIAAVMGFRAPVVLVVLDFRGYLSDFSRGKLLWKVCSDELDGESLQWLAVTAGSPEAVLVIMDSGKGEDTFLRLLRLQHQHRWPVSMVGVVKTSEQLNKIKVLLESSEVHNKNRRGNVVSIRYVTKCS